MTSACRFSVRYLSFYYIYHADLSVSLCYLNYDRNLAISWAFSIESIIQSNEINPNNRSPMIASRYIAPFIIKSDVFICLWWVGDHRNLIETQASVMKSICSHPGDLNKYSLFIFFLGYLDGTRPGYKCLFKLYYNPFSGLNTFLT